MKEFLKKLKLIEYLTITLQMSANEFIGKLSAIVDKSDLGFFSDRFDAFSSSKNELKGQIDFSGFKIKRRRRFFDTNINCAIAKGTFSEHNRTLTIETEINGFSGIFIPFYLFLIIFYSILIFVAAYSKETTFFSSPFLIFHAGLMFGIPYFMMRRGVKRLKYDLEREFYYLTKK